MAAQGWSPYNSLTVAPTNLKEAIDWVLRVTGKDGKKNEKNGNGPHCLCYLAKAVKDLLYDARSPGSPGPSTHRNWENILLTEEQSIVKPVLQDLGLLSGESGTVSTTFTNAGGTEVIKALIEHLAQGLQKWVGWKDERDDKTGDWFTGNGIALRHTFPGVALSKLYESSYNNRHSTLCTWPTLSDKPDQVHLLARIFLGSECLIWSGLSQLGWLTYKGGPGSGVGPWLQSVLNDESKGLGSFMAAMGYDLERLNQEGGVGKKGSDVAEMLKNGFSHLGNSSDKESVAEYYSSIYKKAQEAVEKDKNTEKLCKDYPLLVLHILASGYFRAGSAGAKGVTTAPKAPTSETKKETPSPRKPRTIREILYWLSALPYSRGYKELVTRMDGKMKERIEQENDQNKNTDTLKLHGESPDKKTDLKKGCIPYYLMAACGYCPLVLIGIQGTIEREVKTEAQATVPDQAENKRCDKHKDNPHKRCDPKDIGKQQAAPQVPPAAPAPAAPAGKPLEKGQVCYGGYHLEVSQFGPLHGMYANGLYGFDMGGSAAQCLDQLRTYVYHCFYQLYFLRKQCKEGVEVTAGVGGGKTVLGWQSCRYGHGLGFNSSTWLCSTGDQGGSNGNCKCKQSASHRSPLMCFLCDGIGSMVCNKTIGVGVGSSKQSYPEIDAHMNKTIDSNGKEQPAHKEYPQICPVPMGWSAESTSSGNTGTQNRENHFKDLTKTHKQAALTPPASAGQQNNTYPAHCTGNTLSHLLEYYCDPEKCPSGTLVVLLRLLACITPTVPRTLGDLFGFYYYIVYIGGQKGEVKKKLEGLETEVVLYMGKGNEVVKALGKYSGACSTGKEGHLKCLVGCSSCADYLSPLSGQQYGQLSPVMAGTYLSWLVYLIGEFQEGLGKLKDDYMKVDCKRDGCKGGAAGAGGCGGSGQCRAGSHGDQKNCCGCESVVSCTGVLPVLYKYGFGYGDVETLHKTGGSKTCDAFLTTLKGVLESEKFVGDSSKKTGLIPSVNQLIYTTRLPWIFVLTLAWLVAVLYLAFGAIWPLDWAHMRSHCRGWFRKGSLSPWEVLMVGKKKGRGILEFFGGR